MSGRGPRLTPALYATLAGSLATLLLAAASPARAEAPAWHFEAVLPPQLSGESNEEHDRRPPVALGKIGDIRFWAPNRGLLITAGNPPTIPPGLWSYNGSEWHELSTVCGASDGRIAWAGEKEFWTVSDGRPGQASHENHTPPLEDNTLCHFNGGQVVASYASLAFRTDSYQAMHGAACVFASGAASSSDCWFGGDLLPESEPGVRSQIGAFQLHWNGGSVIAAPYPAEHAIGDLQQFGSYLFESVQIGKQDHFLESESPSKPPVLHLITPIGVQPTFISLTPGVPSYAPEERPAALGYVHLSSDEDGLWGAAGPARIPGSAPGEVTVIHYSAGRWAQVLGFGTDPPGGNPFTQPGREESQNETPVSVAAEPATHSAWLALDPQSAVRSSGENANVARITAAGELSERQTLPKPGEGVTAKGAAAKISCPEQNNCWLVTTEGWLFHYYDAAHRTLPRDTDPAFANLITFRPPDAGVPQVVPDAPPVDDSGLLGELPSNTSSALEVAAASEARVPVALLSRVRSRLLRGTTLELRFHLAVKARVRLVAKRRKRVVASTPLRTLAAGDHSLLLKLSRRAWPTKLDLQTQALAPLPTESLRGAGSGTVGTDFHVLPRAFPSGTSGALP